jgi:hypothetical protein
MARPGVSSETGTGVVTDADCLDVISYYEIGKDRWG